VRRAGRASVRGCVMSGVPRTCASFDGCERKQHLCHLLDEALELIDSLGLPSEIGARLQEVIDLTHDCRNEDGRSAC